MVAPIINMPNTVKHNGISGIPTQLLVLHSGESPLRGGFAQSLTNWANTPLSAGGPVASWHWFVDPIAIVSMVPPQYAAWHASEANPMSEGFEQAGYARFTRAEWLTADGLKQIDNLGWLMAQRAKANGIPMKWLTTDQVNAITSGRDRTTKGFCTHRQIDPDTRTDPGNGYPFDVLTNKITAYMGGAPSEDTLSAAEVKQIKDHINAVLLGGYQWEGKTHPGIGMVVEEEQRRAAEDRKHLREKLPAEIAAAVWSTVVKRTGGDVSALQELADAKTEAMALRAAVAGMVASGNTSLTAEEIIDAVKAGIADGRVTVDINVKGPAPAAE